MDKENIFFVYIYKDPTNNIIRYVGKGYGNRDLVHLNRVKNNSKTEENKRFYGWIRNCLDQEIEPLVERVSDNLSNKEAYLAEHSLIKKYGRKGFEENGILLNLSIGLEHINLTKDGIELDKYLYEIDNYPHFNSRSHSKKVKDFIIEIYGKGIPLRKIPKEVFKKFKVKIGVDKVRSYLKESNIHIRTKSETRRGELNPAYGRKGLITKGFSNRHHSDDSKYKISVYQLKKYIENMDLNKLKEVVKLKEEGVSISEISRRVNLGRRVVCTYLKKFKENKEYFNSKGID